MILVRATTTLFAYFFFAYFSVSVLDYKFAHDCLHSTDCILMIV